MGRRGLEEGIGVVGVLDDPVRLRVYRVVRGAGRRMRRDEVAAAAGISRNLAAFHLDKLAATGLLEVSFGRPEGRAGPGAGRPAKFYEPSDLEVEVSIPERRYDLAGDLLVRALRAQPGRARTLERARTVAHEAGVELGEAVRRELRLLAPARERALAVAEGVLGRHGYEPAREGERLILRNCPFHALSREAPELVCVMNHAFIEGLVQGLGSRTVDVILDRAEGRCCVILQPAGRSKPRRPKPDAVER